MAKKIFIIAAEVSGDILGSEIMRVAPKDFEFVGIGGNEMRAQGLRSLFNISDFSVMGFVDVLKKAKLLKARIRAISDAVIKAKPDVVLTIDSSSLMVRVIKNVRRAKVKTKFYHVVAPMVWAWGAWRAKKYAKVFDKLFCFFDFEKPFFTKYGLDTTVIGFPVYNVVKRHQKSVKMKKYFALLPGSRMGEVTRMMDIFKELSERLPEYNYAIPVAETTKKFVEEHIKSWDTKPKIFQFSKRYDLYNESRLAVSVNGTSTAELAIMGVPMIMVSNMGKLNEFIGKFIMTVKYRSLVNIISGKEIYPELVGKNVTAENIVKLVGDLDEKKIVSELKKTDKLWHKTTTPMKIVVDAIGR